MERSLTTILSILYLLYSIRTEARVFLIIKSFSVCCGEDRREGHLWMELIGRDSPAVLNPKLGNRVEMLFEVLSIN